MLLAASLLCSSLVASSPSAVHVTRVTPLTLRAAANRPPPAAFTTAASLPLLLRPEPALAVGASLLLLLVTNRLFTDTLLNSQSRADLIAAIAPVLIVLKALGDIDITPREAEPVALGGVDTAWVEDSLPPAARRELEWAADALTADSPACAALAFWCEGRTLLLRGSLAATASASRAEAVVPGPLLSKCMDRVNGAPDYLPALQLLPGRVEFSYFPPDTQGVLMLPLVGAKRGALILACDRQRGFQPDNLAWARAVATRLGELDLPPR